MLNKKIVAVAIAASLSTSAFAVQDLSSSTTKAVSYASELQSTGSTTDIVTGAGNALSVSSEVGFGFAVSTKRYIAFTLENAEFKTAVTATDLTYTDTSAGTAAPTKLVLDGGTAESTSVLFEVTGDTQDSASDDVFTLAIPDLTVTNGATVTATYAIYETLTNAANGVNALKSYTGPVATFASANVKSPLAADATTLKPTATVGSEFEKFDNTAETEAILGKIDATGTVDTTVLVPSTGAAVAFANIYGPVARTATLTGDLSFVDDAFISASATCASKDIQLVENEAKTSAASAATAVTMSTTPQYVCLEVDGETEIAKGSYSLSLVNGTTSTSASLADVTYDTLSVEVPYLTTFEDYNQRLFLVNSSSLAASYSFSFTSEDGVTATAGTAAEGSIPAKSMIAIKATDIVTLEGKTRTSAVIELEAEDKNIQITSQTVNLSDGTTDTVIYN